MHGEPTGDAITQFHLLSFEGPDSYSRAGGIANRITGLSQALSNAGFDTHLWFIGDPELPGREQQNNLTLHRWCQWISRFHPGGVYDGEEGKRSDYVESLPPFLLRRVLLPYLSNPARRGVVLAEEWQTVHAVLHLEWLLRCAGLRDRVTILWNANNTFGFERIDWERLSGAAKITTVSRYMRQRMWQLGVDPLVIPNGIPEETLRQADRITLGRLQRAVGSRLTIAKVARWDPDKRWLLAVDAVAELKREGKRPLLIARGGVEAHGAEVLGRASAVGLRVVERSAMRSGVSGLMECLEDTDNADVVVLKRHLCADAKRVLFRKSHVVLVNSGHEPFGLVGLEAMAAGGIACVGGTGEDYATPGWNAFVLQTTNPRELLGVLNWLRSNPHEERLIRGRAVITAKQYAWPAVVSRNLLRLLQSDGVDRARMQSAPRLVSRPQRRRSAWRPAGGPVASGCAVLV